jgi:hypothetical protein
MRWYGNRLVQHIDGGNRIMTSIQPDAWHHGKWRARSCSGELSEIADSKPKAKETGVADGARCAAGSAATIAARGEARGLTRLLFN